MEREVPIGQEPTIRAVNPITVEVIVRGDGVETLPMDRPCGRRRQVEEEVHEGFSDCMDRLYRKMDGLVRKMDYKIDYLSRLGGCLLRSWI